MIDFHTHILPSIDDGSRSGEETFNLIKEARDAGFNGIMLTSHYIENYYETGIDERELCVKAIQDNLNSKGIDVKLYIGNEVYITNNVMSLLEEGKASTINNSCYVLFEMPFHTEPMNLYDFIYTLQENKLIPVLAHPERYSFVQKEPELIYELIQKGCLMQVNFGSIIGQYGSKAEFMVKRFYENNMVHFIGSDVHRQNSTYPKIPMCLEEIQKIIGRAKLEELTEINPRLVLENKKIDIDDPIEFSLTFKEKMMMNLKRK